MGEICVLGFSYLGMGMVLVAGSRMDALGEIWVSFLFSLLDTYSMI